ncbi:MAG TPA: hypothetical protein VGC13_24750 [Longimicrobium sp.]|jgi:hypothetical protein|uniref:hypothetical protein n=1 Tax=Longimicrobium sp. TaxID=2029185 RepID=UPI002EDACDA0
MRMVPRLALLLLALATMAQVDAAAQDAVHTLAPGDTVRVLAPAWGPRMVEGEVLVYHTDSLAVRESATGRRYAVALGGVQELMKNEGPNRRRSVRRSALGGLFVGFALGVVAGPLLAMGRKDDDFLGTTVLTSLGGGAMGLGVGAAAGSVFARDHWQPFRTPILPADVSAPISSVP